MKKQYEELKRERLDLLRKFRKDLQGVQKKYEQDRRKNTNLCLDKDYSFIELCLSVAEEMRVANFRLTYPNLRGEENE